MTQLNIQVSPEFEQNLQRYMKLKGIRTKSEALRTAVRESLNAIVREERKTDFNAWLGAAKRVPQNPRPRFPTDDALWE